MAVLVGFVPSEQGEAAVAAALEECLRRNEELYVINTASGQAFIDPRYAQGEDMERVRALAETKGVAVKVLQPVRGREPHEEILDAVEQWPISVLVIGLRKRSPVGKLLMGSTAQRLLMESPVPVLAVKPTH